MDRRQFFKGVCASAALVWCGDKLLSNSLGGRYGTINGVGCVSSWKLTWSGVEPYQASQSTGQISDDNKKKK